MNEPHRVIHLSAAARRYQTSRQQNKNKNRIITRFSPFSGRRLNVDQAWSSTSVHKIKEV
jgi:hypothetical protein